MNRVLLAFIASLILALAGAGFAQDGHVTIGSNLTDELADDAGVDELGDAMYDAQEGVHESVTEATGEEIEHSYIWICLGQSCVPVDPVRFRN